ncbi:MAG: YbdD/YjiX family protein [Mycobacteriaceae bacterium]|jgi:uncharacterized short protein YbdD (DUF466 family)
MGRVSAIADKIRWYVGSLMGDSHYRRYVEYRNRAHPGEPLLSESGYWRMRHDMTDRSPTPRCC